MTSIAKIETILHELLSKEIKAYINNLTKEDFCTLATIYVIGRDGWDKTFLDDNKCLTKNLKKEQIAIAYNTTISSVRKEHGIYMHGWLDGKGKHNLINYGNKGLNMLKEIM